jgi:ATP-dependent RNA helicase RhlE
MPVSKIKQKIIRITNSDKLVNLKSIIDNEKIFHAIIFTRTKKRADNLAKNLNKNKYKAMAIHGDKRQSQRVRILNDFKNSKLNFLIATDVAARGIDIHNIMFVINYDLPTQPEIYVHRIGRTARAGKEGVSISLFDNSELKKLRSIERLIGKKFEIDKTELKKNLQKETFIEKKSSKPFLKVTKNKKKNNVISIKSFKKRKKKNH